ncbi:hypothetical protein DPMN_179909 [Dreissena polymorpha]|uniref:Uncharacterized protein n=1 Tax=Dreissena polymorpha TaxID=45954 RepID=A0A9D4EFB7_DREPO|nr:hypothetical protein DPMN_179909 [Dreissena polymorpha]
MTTKENGWAYPQQAHWPSSKRSTDHTSKLLGSAVSGTLAYIKRSTDHSSKLLGLSTSGTLGFIKKVN